MDPLITSKRCSSCKMEKPLSDFGFRKRSKDAHHYKCKVCTNLYTRKTRSPDFVSTRRKVEVVDGLLKCTRCNEIKPLTAFSKNRSSHTGLDYCCKDCTRRISKTRLDNLRVIGVVQKVGRKVCSHCGVEKDITLFRILIGGSGGRSRVCKDCINSSERERQSSQNHVPDLQGTKVCSSCGLLKKNTEFYKFKHHKDGLDSACKDCVQLRKSSYFRKNVVAQLRFKIRRRLGYYAKRNKCLNKDYAILFLGCSLHELLSYLEIRFYSDPRTGEAMTWDNYGQRGWHIDHIYPLSKVNLLDDLEFKRACHYTNLQPLWWWENLEKSSKITSDLKSEVV